MSGALGRTGQPRIRRLTLTGVMSLQVILLLMLATAIPVYWLLESAAAPSDGAVAPPFVWTMALVAIVVGAAVTYALGLAAWARDWVHGDVRRELQTAVSVSISLVLINVVTLGLVAFVTLELRDGWKLLLSLAALVVGVAFAWFLRLMLHH